MAVVSGHGLVGRDSELAQIEAVLDRACRGTSGALVLRGEAGIGKTALLERATALAGDMRVLTARGIESESDLPFAALVELLRPAWPAIDTISAELAATLRGALALGPTVPASPLRIGVAVLTLLAQVADERPLLVVLDDVHWADQASATALLFAARRLGAEGVAMLFAVRDDEARVPDTSGLPELELHGLDRAASRRLLDQIGRSDVSGVAFTRLHAALGGNPLALIEGVRLLSASERSRGEPPPVLPRTSERLERAFARRISGLGADTRRALLVVAAAESSDSEGIAAALHELGLRFDALEEAEASGVVRTRDGRIDFSHPLVRTAAYHAAGPAQRRAAHLALARSLAQTAPDRSVLHRAAAAQGPDEELAGALEDVSRAIAARGARLEAARALERAARLTPRRAARAERFLAASRHATLGADYDHAAALVSLGLGDATDAPIRAALELQRGLIRLSVGSLRAAGDGLVEGARAVEGPDPQMATLMLVGAAFAYLLQGEVRLALTVSERALELARIVGQVAEVPAGAALATARVLAGERAAEVAPLLRFASALASMPPAGLPPLALLVLRWIERFDDATQFLRTRIAAARARAKPMSLAYDLASLSEVELSLGDLSGAYADAAEATQLARDTDQRGFVTFCLAQLARVEALLGREHDCRKHAAEALELSGPLGAGAIPVYAGSALGLLELGLGQPHDALRALEPIGELTEAKGIEGPNVVPWQADLIEAYVRAGRPADAERELAVFERRAERSGCVWAAAAALRCRGLLAAPDQFEAYFRDALALHATQPLPIERARTELCWGERMRRTGRRGDAREPLRRALDTFDRHSARPWATLAHAELLAAGERSARQRSATELDLTAQELQVARVVSAGATNSEAAAQLFISAKTVEKHLTSAYRKLGLRSRAELAVRLAGGT